MTPCGETQFSVVPPSNSLVSVLDPERAFTAHSVAIASYIAYGTPEKQGYRQVCRARCRVPGHHQDPLI